MAGRQVTTAVVERIAQWEGVVLFAYDDAVYPTRPVRPGEKIRGTLTIGAGHTGPDVHVGQVINDTEAQRLLLLDLRDSEAAVLRLVKHPELLTDNQYGCLVDFVFNVGTTAFANSTLLRKLNAGDFAAVPAELQKWVYTTVNGQKVKSNGLVARRAHEAALWAESAMPAPGHLPTAIAEPAPAPTVSQAGSVGVGAVIVGGLAAPWLGGVTGNEWLIPVALLACAGAAAYWWFTHVKQGKTA
jgi:lysozyme